MPIPSRFNIQNVLGVPGAPGPTGATGSGLVPQYVVQLASYPAPAPRAVVIVDGYNAAGDGGGGTFVWNASDTRPDDGGTILQVSGVTTGRWNRVYSGAVNVRWYGATGNGSTDDTAAVQAAINHVIEVKGALYIPTGVYACNALTLNYAQGMSVRGDRSTYNGSTSTGTVIKWTGGSTGTLLTILDAQELDFEHVHFYGQNGGTNAVDQNTFGVNVSSDNAPASYYVTFHRCTFSEFGTCVTWGVNPYQCDKGGIFDSEFWYYTRYGFYVGSANALDQGEIKGCSFVGAPGTTFLPLIATSGTAPPAVMLTGTPAPGDVRIDMNVTTGGPRGTALFTWKLNGVTQQTGQVTAATFALGATGLTLNFPTGTYFTDNVYEAFATNAVGMYFFWCGMMRVTDCVGGGYHKYFAQVNTSLANQIVFTNCEAESGPGSWQFYFSGGSDGVTHTLLSNTVTSGVYVGGTSRVLGIANTFLYGGNPPNAGVLLDGSGAKYVGLRDRFTSYNIPTGTTCVINSGIYHNQDLPNASAFGEPGQSDRLCGSRRTKMRRATRPSSACEVVVARNFGNRTRRIPPVSTLSRRSTTGTCITPLRAARRTPLRSQRGQRGLGRLNPLTGRSYGSRSGRRPCSNPLGRWGTSPVQLRQRPVGTRLGRSSGILHRCLSVDLR